MITLNAKSFAESKSEFKNMEANNDITCVGFARRYKRQIKLFDKENNIIGVINRFGVLASATPVEGGIWYSYANIDAIGSYDSYTQMREEIDNLAVDYNYLKNSTERLFQFKS